jgi:hypothetical protein
LSLHTDFRLLIENDALLREILTWGRESSRQNYFLFPKLNFSLKGRHFETVEEIQCPVTRELTNISKTAFLEGMKKLKERANKCIDQGGMYCEE